MRAKHFLDCSMRKIFVLECHCVIVKPNEKLQDRVFELRPIAALDGSQPNSFFFVNFFKNTKSCVFKHSEKNSKTMCRNIMNHILLCTKACEESGLESQCGNLIPDSLHKCQPFRYYSFKCLCLYATQSAVFETTRSIICSGGLFKFAWESMGLCLGKRCWETFGFCSSGSFLGMCTDLKTFSESSYRVSAVWWPSFMYWTEHPNKMCLLGLNLSLFTL